ncbi:MAG TPA: Asp-tRNA(Asn)/Glu-tRNA(Gln) amidotransferase GatCAB subunit B [Dehalococcoidia bacterium]|nr:Asp-tRNA(Asn)/Glu-tRNA(Gln) amidotransferase GatCAB subunit B [Dehalococcoidia bacterium]
MSYENIIGLEVHAQLLTKSKMYCSCSADYASAPPNTHVCPVCLGMPGVLPTINKRAVEFVMMTAMALNCPVAEYAKFDRKNYCYPDLMKGYQISEYDAPIGLKGWLEIEADGKKKKIGITRVHLEEDVAKLTHVTSPEGETYSLVDVNRAGMPLMEIVSEPDISTPEEARQYLMKLRSILVYLGVSTGNMEEGSFRCDANISIRQIGTKEFGPKVEVKNMNSFKAVARALEFEAERQRKELESGGRIVQETRGWVDDQGITVSQRSKEYAHDYRYFPEPDLPPMKISREWVEQIKAGLVELPDEKKNRFMEQYGLSDYDASLLTESQATAQYFERCVELVGDGAAPEKQKKNAKAACNWILGDFSKLLNASNASIDVSKCTPQHLSGMLKLLDSGAITGPIAKTIFEEMYNSGTMPDIIIKEKGLSQISDTGEIENIVRQVMESNAQAVADYRAGKQQSLTFLIGQLMKATKGKANPDIARKILIENLGGK